MQETRKDWWITWCLWVLLLMVMIRKDGVNVRQSFQVDLSTVSLTRIGYLVSQSDGSMNQDLHECILAFVYRLHSLNTEVAGLRPIKNVHRIENVELELDGHTKYRDSVQEILIHIGMA